MGCLEAILGAPSQTSRPYAALYELRGFARGAIRSHRHDGGNQHAPCGLSLGSRGLAELALRQAAFKYYKVDPLAAHLPSSVRAGNLSRRDSPKQSSRRLLPAPVRMGTRAIEGGNRFTWEKAVSGLL